MKKITTIIALSFLIISCSSENESMPEQNQNPTDISISNTSPEIGDIITLTGSNFDPNENYIISINGIQGIIIEITTTYIKFELPQGSTSGNIILSFKDQDMVIGNIEIITSSNLIYAIKSNFSSNTETTKFVNVSSINGENTVLLDLQTTDNIESASFNEATNQINFITSLGDGNLETEIYTIDVSSNSFSMKNLNNDSEIDYQLVPKNNGTLYAIKQSYVSEVTTSKLVSINPSNGSETVLLDLQTTDNFNSLAFNSQTNKIFGVTSIGDGNLDSEIYTIDLSNNSYSFQPLSSQFRYELVISDSGILYGMEYDSVNNTSSKLYTLNPENGSKTLIIDMQTTDNFNNLIVFENKLFGITSIGDGNLDSEIYTIDLQNDTFSFTQLGDNNEVDFELVN